MNEESGGEKNTWELWQATRFLPKEQTADVFNEDWDMELKADQGNPYGRCGVSPVGVEFPRPEPDVFGLFFQINPEGSLGKGSPGWFNLTVTVGLKFL